jgi:hypothetical protein
MTSVLSGADKKFVIYKWASEQCVSETYKYRARASPYNAVATSDSWLLDDKDTDQKKKPLARRYTDNMKDILDTVMADSAVSQSSMQFERSDELKDDLRRQRLTELKANKNVKRHAETSQKYDTLEDTDVPEVEKDFKDDGYSQLTVHDYIACRTIPQHKLIQEKLPELNSRKNLLQVLMYVMSTVSVLLATLNMDLYIAISVSTCPVHCPQSLTSKLTLNLLLYCFDDYVQTSTISLLSGILEYQKLETRVASLNRAFKDLTQILHDWDSYTFVEVGIKFRRPVSCRIGLISSNARFPLASIIIRMRFQLPLTAEIVWVSRWLRDCGS